MVKGFRKYTALLIFLIGIGTFAQGHLSSSVSLSKNSVYVGEPVQVTVSVFTSTWFTKGVNPGNIKVNGAFTVYFRSLSTSKQVNGKTYAGVQLYFNVFPHENEPIEFPSLEIEVETPDPGGYKGVKHIVRTNPRTINVKSIPPNFDADSWLVTTWMSATENWKGDLKNVKVGDVLERSIYRNASNTVSELIPPVKWDTIANVSLYPTRSEVANNKTKTAISATRTEGVRYLFEKEGEIIIPKKELTWYNPYKKKLYKKTLPEVVINVQANPDLGMLASVKEQLEKDKSTAESEEQSAITVLGLSLKQFSLYLLIGIILVYVLIKLIKVSLKIHNKRKADYLQSEKYYFDVFIKSIPSKSAKEILPKLYRWIDELPLENSTTSNLRGHIQSSNLTSEIDKVGITTVSLNLNKTLWRQIRKQVLDKSSTNEKVIQPNWINP
ncbi:BatD family protein [Urechidicola vernalis]|uniref:BatD family protein n=1 Tax=Urechidicola vernalis TaxID=3075600 RepID=A0ABU2Y5G9_9FLAO|nr:BatD family protein [Urechidicola sp. P050]MDT0553448.1 BatD family protein [Urechidicola sp. P050]